MKDKLKQETGSIGGGRTVKSGHQHLEGLYAVSFRYAGENKEKFTMQINKRTEILYRDNQNYKYKAGNSNRLFANILIMNYLCDN